MAPECQGAIIGEGGDSRWKEIEAPELAESGTAYACEVSFVSNVWIVLVV